MASKLSKSKSNSKGSNKAITSTITAKNPFTLASKKYAKYFELKYQTRLIVKQFMWKSVTVGCLDIPDVVKLVEHQQMDYFLQLAQDYNEDIICVFYSGLHEMQGSYFSFFDRWQRLSVY